MESLIQSGRKIYKSTFTFTLQDEDDGREQTALGYAVNKKKTCF